MSDNNKRDWAVSKTGGPKIEGVNAAKLLRVSKAQMYVLVERGDLKRAEPRNKGLRRQAFNFFLKDILDLALQYETLTPEEAAKLMQDAEAKLMHPNGAAALVVAAA